MEQQTYGTQRQAAARNRAAILEAAHDVLERNPHAPFSEIAKLSGVGTGTLYRHFPTREDLLLAVARADIERLTLLVDEVLTRNTSARAAFVEWFETLAAYVRVKHGLGDALHGAAAQRLVADAWAPMTDAVRTLVDACVEERTIAPGHDPADVIVLMSFLWRVSPDEAGLARGRRLTATVFSGLQAKP